MSNLKYVGKYNELVTTNKVLSVINWINRRLFDDTLSQILVLQLPKRAKGINIPIKSQYLAKEFQDSTMNMQLIQKWAPRA